MAKEKLLGHVSYIHVDGETFRWDSLTSEKRSEYSKRMMDNVGKAVSDYFRCYPEELEKFLKGLKECSEE